MYKQNKIQQTSIKLNQSYQGERIEEKINRIVNNKEPISDGAPLLYTERSEGVNPAYDIRTDRFEIATEAMDKVAKSHIAKREENIKAFTEKLDKQNEKNNPTQTKTDGGAEPAAGTEK